MAYFSTCQVDVNRNLTQTAQKNKEVCREDRQEREDFKKVFFVKFACFAVQEKLHQRDLTIQDMLEIFALRILLESVSPDRGKRVGPWAWAD